MTSGAEPVGRCPLVRVCGRGELPPPGEGVTVEVGEQAIAIFNVEGTYRALDGWCTHGNALLAEGYLDGEVVECAWHGAQFDVVTGQVLKLPARKPLRTFAVRIDGDDVFLAGVE